MHKHVRKSLFSLLLLLFKKKKKSLRKRINEYYDDDEDDYEVKNKIMCNLFRNIL